MNSLWAIFILLLIGWYWLDSLRARELALGICRAACEQRALQLLDQTVALRRLRLRWTADGIRLRRTYRPGTVMMAPGWRRLSLVALAWGICSPSPTRVRSLSNNPPINRVAMKPPPMIALATGRQPGPVTDRP